MKIYRTLVLSLPLFVFGCSKDPEAQLYASSPLAESLDPEEVEALNHLGPTFTDDGINFGVFSSRAERVELLLFEDPEDSL